MADNRPLIVQRQLSRLDSPENHDTYTLQWQTRTTQAGWLAKTTNCCTAVLTLLAVLSLLSVFLLWTLANTVYEPIQITQDPLVETLRPNDTILVQHFNPFYIENVTFASNEKEFLLKRTPCRELANESQEINESLAILNVTKSAYEIATFYLLKGSLLTMTFEFEHTLTNYSVLASLYIYNKKSKFDNFLRNGPKSKTKPSQVFKSSNKTLASVLNISQTNNYFIGLLIPQDSEVQEVHYNIRGNEIHYIETWAEPTCMLTPPTNGTCVMDFTNPHVNSEKDNICILGMNTGEEFAPLELKVNGNGYVNRVSFILVELSFGVCGGVVVANMLILLCVCLMQELKNAI